MSDKTYSRDFPAGRHLREGYFVYRYWDKGDVCLYIGMVGGFKNSPPMMLLSRLGTHASNRAPWAIEAQYIDWISLESVDLVAEEEATQIRLHQPRYNVMKNGFCRRNLHDLTLPGALKTTSNGSRACRACINARRRKNRELRKDREGYGEHRINQ